MKMAFYREHLLQLTRDGFVIQPSYMNTHLSHGLHCAIGWIHTSSHQFSCHCLLFVSHPKKTPWCIKTFNYWHVWSRVLHGYRWIDDDVVILIWFSDFYFVGLYIIYTHTHMNNVPFSYSLIMFFYFLTCNNVFY